MGKKGKKKSKGQLKREAALKAKLEAQAQDLADKKREEAIARGEDPEEEAKKEGSSFRKS